MQLRLAHCWGRLVSVLKITGARFPDNPMNETGSGTGSGSRSVGRSRERAVPDRAPVPLPFPAPVPLPFPAPEFPGPLTGRRSRRSNPDTLKRAH
jgi:hypothetical protein